MLVAMRTGSEQNLLPWILALAQKWERATWTRIEVEREHFSNSIMYFKKPTSMLPVCVRAISSSLF